MASDTKPAIKSQIHLMRLGQADHLRVADHHDLAAVLELDEAQWIATTAPTATINADAVFLNLLDYDGDGRIRAEEVKDAIRYLFSQLRDRSGIVANNTTLLLDSVSRETELGRSIHTSATKVLRRQNSKASSVTLEQARAVKEEVLEGGLDEAGIVLPEAADDESIKTFIQDVIETVGGKPHSSGNWGLDDEALKTFLEEGEHYLQWLREAGSLEQLESTPILPLGGGTADAYELFRSLKVKLTQYFLLCDIKRVNPELLRRALQAPDGTLSINLIDVSEAENFLADAPLASPDEAGRLTLASGINPHFHEELEALFETVITPLLGADRDGLDKFEFRELQDLLAPYEEWLATKPEVRVDKLGAAKVKRYVDEHTFRRVVHDLILESHRTAFVLENLRELERLILYQSYILPFVNSFVSFPQLYDPSARALFEMGTLVMDGRHFTLAVRVLDRGRHKEASKDSNIFVLYLEIFGSGGEKAYEVAVPVTSGNRGTLRLNKWGIFNDAKGAEWHARVIDIVENPISVSEAMVDPFLRIGRSMVNRLESLSNQTEQKLVEGAPIATKRSGDAPSGGFLAGGGIAVAALGSSFAFATKTLAAVSIRHIVIALLAIAAIVTIPAGVAAYYKLSRRDLSAILEGSGWGVNARMKLTKKQATTFTFEPSHRDRS